jgi:hypothetical protein
VSRNLQQFSAYNEKGPQRPRIPEEPTPQASNNHARKNRRLCPDRRLRNRRPDRQTRLHRLALLARFLLRRLFRRPPRHRGKRPLENHARRRRMDYHPPLSHPHAHPRNHIQPQRRLLPPHRLHAPPPAGLPRCPHRPRHSRQGRRPHGDGAPLRLRPNSPLGHAHQGRHPQSPVPTSPFFAPPFPYTEKTSRPLPISLSAAAITSVSRSPMAAPSSRTPGKSTPRRRCSLPLRDGAAGLAASGTAANIAASSSARSSRSTP